MKHRAYIDIETTGLNRHYDELTVIGIGLEKDRKVDVVQLIEGDLCEARLSEVLTGINEIYSYNGSRFDLPFIEAGLGVDLKKCFRHTDLMYDCWRNDLKGGLKVVEAKLGIDRSLKGITGYIAVKLWWDYINNGNKQALATLLQYNAEDVANLELLRLNLGVE